MFQSSIIHVQIVLIGLGICFQFMAFSSHRGARPVYPQGHDEMEEKKPETKKPVFRKNTEPKSARRSSKPHQPVRDYYDVENPQPGVAPGLLVRTAKVSYFNGVNVKLPPKTE